MTETDDRQAIEQGLKLQEEFSDAIPSQDMLDDVPEEALPSEYRDNIRLRMTRDSFFVAFSDNPESLEPNEEGLLPNAHIRKLPAMTMPRRLGKSIKDWIEQIKEEESNS